MAHDEKESMVVHNGVVHRVVSIHFAPGVFRTWLSRTWGRILYPFNTGIVVARVWESK